MSFKENIIKKIKIDQLAENVRLSLKKQDNGTRVDKTSMRQLLDIASYQYERQRDLDLYIKQNPAGAMRILVLDNELAIYATGIADVVLRKSPTIKEMINIRNAVKILSDSDVVVCKKTDSVAAVHQECVDALDLTLNRSDLEAIAEDGRIALEINDPDGVRLCLSLFYKLLDFSLPPRHLSVGTLEIAGKRTTTENGEILFGPAVIYRPADNHLKYMEETISSLDRQRADILLQATDGKVKAAGEGPAVFQYLKDIAIGKYF
ncbi:MAG: hypothetical protein P1P89_08900 [Desulfobacterales bacterium]|nr:hypothetical protein [Desulfobacterales bacterium]